MITKLIRVLILFTWAIFLVTPSMASDSSAGDSGNGDSRNNETKTSQPEFTSKGADACLKCHDEDSEFPVMAIFKTPHATQADPHSPFSQHQCESCHGPGGDHAKRLRRGEDRPPMLGFDKDSFGSVEERNNKCLSCHQSEHTQTWKMSEHQAQGLQCTSCHQIHVAKDPVLETESQAEVCFNCHKKQRADALKFSAHPLRFGKMSCTGCHQPHSSENEASLNQFTVNDTCFTCHAEKRGPFLWEHAPASEDCSLCHQAHGSSHNAMLKKRAPLLCQECHSASDHPGTAYTSDNLNQRSAEIFLLGNSCTNCHSMVHGSNHPSGASLNR